MLLTPGATCWRKAVADRAAVLVDMADYFDAAEVAMRGATRSIHLLNWSFEPETLMHPEPGCSGPDSDRIANILIELAKRPGLDVRLLCWDSALPVASTQHFFPIAARIAFRGTLVKFKLDAKLPAGAAHHQKMIIIDDAIAFCGGGDIGPDRWDTPQHLDNNPRREKTRYDHRDFDSRHEVMCLVEGAPARLLGALFRDRWERATGERLAEAAEGGAAPWPSAVRPTFSRVEAGVSRTAARWRTYPEVRECEALHLSAIAQARRCIYMENQYFTSPVIAAALAARLAAPDGPDVVLVSTQHSPSYFDQMTMDKTRSKFIERLKAADRHGRLAVYSPVTTLGRTIIVHAKLTIIDDTLLRIGSANINNRSMGFDTECDFSLEAEPGSDNAAAIVALRTRLLAHWLGCAEAVVEAELDRQGGVLAALEALRLAGYCRLRPIEPIKLRPLARFIAAFHLGDPVGPDDSWRPWRRKQALAHRLSAACAPQDQPAG
jgi:phosphatidylserine/phosphatidylglycerophosphate/cardiolipin synthase-like enzyme